MGVVWAVLERRWRVGIIMSNDCALSPSQKRCFTTFYSLYFICVLLKKSQLYVELSKCPGLFCVFFTV